VSLLYNHVLFRGEAILTSVTLLGGRQFYIEGTYLPISLVDSYKLGSLIENAKKSKLYSWIEKHDLG
jgi:hypothetical protein